MARERLVVVGNGMVGLRFLEALAGQPPGDVDVTVIGAEPCPAYNRVLLSSLLAGEVSEADCEGRDRSWYAANDFALLTGREVTAIDRAGQRVCVAGHDPVPYDRLVLATGSEAVRPPWPGVDQPGVVTFRTQADVTAMRALRPGQRAVVIGGGLLGLEAAYGLARARVETTLVHLMDRVLERQLDAPAARLVEHAMRDKGVTLELQAKTAAIEPAGVRLADGRCLPADLVVVAVGVRPRAQLAAAAGLAVGRGIVVDDGLTTSDPRIHAIGECAEHRGCVHGLVEPGYEQAAVLAARLRGEAVFYAGTTPSTRLKVSGVPVFSAGDVLPGPDADVVTLSDPAAGRYAKLVFAEQRLTGAILVGDVRHATAYLDLIRNGADVSPHRHDLVFGPPPQDAKGYARAA